VTGEVYPEVVDAVKGAQLVAVARLVESGLVGQAGGVSASELSGLCEQLAGEVADKLKSGRSKKWRCRGICAQKGATH
jgi:hypothetical protein